MLGRRTALLAAAVGVALIGAGCSQPTRAGASGAALEGTRAGFGLPKATNWQIVTAPDIPGPGDLFGGVAMTGPADGWAGGYRRGSDTYPEPMISRWDGTSWHLVTLPRTIADQLDSAGQISASTPGNVWSWALDNNHNRYGYKLLRWDGQTWSLPANPSLTQAEREWSHTSIAASGTNELWIATMSRLIHVTGDSSVVVPYPAGLSRIDAIEAVAADDVWFVGMGGAKKDPVIAHWNGSRLTVMPTPPVPAVDHDDAQFWFSSFANARDGWVMGSLVKWGEDGENSVARLSWQWNGTAWTSKVVPAPPDTRGYRPLTADGNGGLWATMDDGESEVPAPPHNMWHYVPGQRWQKSIAPTWDGFNLEVHSAAMIPGTDDLFVTADLMKWTEPRQTQAVILRGTN
jgi:hypothetical protein